MNRNPLLADLEEDLVAESLSRPPTPAPKANEWTEPTSWRFTGYVARVRLVECPSCHGWEWVSEGVFAEEQAINTKGEPACRGRKLTGPLAQFPMSGSNRRMETHRVMGEICSKCLDHMGFTDMVEAPEIITNISGQGFTTPRPRTSLGYQRKLTRREEE